MKFRFHGKKRNTPPVIPPSTGAGDGLQMLIHMGDKMQNSGMKVDNNGMMKNSAPVISDIYSNLWRRISVFSRHAHVLRTIVWLIVTIASVLLSVNSSWSQKPVGGGKGNRMDTIVTIRELKDSVERPLEPAKHKDRDIEIFKDYFRRGRYFVDFYRNENTSLKCYRVYLSSIWNYDAASYRWKDDTTIVLRLFDPKSTKEEGGMVWGHRKRTGMAWPLWKRD